MIIADKPPLDEALLKHYGVKGMKWGRRKNRSYATETKEQRQASRAKNQSPSQ